MCVELVHCKNCKWWGKDYPGACGKRGVATWHTPYEATGKEFKIRFEDCDDCASTDGELLTGPEFGCVAGEFGACVLV